VIDVAAGEEIPRKGGPAITRSDLLIINKTDLAPHVGASLEIMERDSEKMRQGRPFLFCQVKHGKGVDELVEFIKRVVGFSFWMICRTIIVSVSLLIWVETCVIIILE